MGAAQAALGRSGPQPLLPAPYLCPSIGAERGAPAVEIFPVGEIYPGLYPRTTSATARNSPLPPPRSSTCGKPMHLETEKCAEAVSTLQAAGVRPPKTLALAITDGCNLCCAHCWVAAAPALPPAVRSPCRCSSGLLDEFALCGGQAVCFTGGEPLCHPQWRCTSRLRAPSRLRRRDLQTQRHAFRDGGGQRRCAASIFPACRCRSVSMGQRRRRTTGCVGPAPSPRCWRECGGCARRVWRRALPFFSPRCVTIWKSSRPCSSWPSEMGVAAAGQRRPCSLRPGGRLRAGCTSRAGAVPAPARTLR